ncbi:MAG: Ig-like domain-containing protein [Phycisphaerae bacterium]|nr:Ig-like domain-containing protein [Phycisphaerae bacterium]MDW8262046.1 Ig-like domain-containing protein [Phycisphaerales bacterium]
MKRTNYLVTALAVSTIGVSSVMVFQAAQKFGTRELAIARDEMLRPGVTFTRPANGETGVLPNAFVACDLSLPNPGSGVDVATMNDVTVRLYKADTMAPVRARLNTSGAGDAIVLQPLELLQPATRYIFEVTDKLKDTTGAPFRPMRINFTTAATARTESYPVAFEKVQMPQTQVMMPGREVPSAYTAIAFGKDGKLYAGTFDGRIFCYEVKPDGTLASPQTISTIQSAEQGPRIITGITFDPKSTASDPILWVAHGQMAFNEGRIEGAADWTSKITVLSGPSLSSHQDIVINLPRGYKDHLTFQMAFGPDGALYFCQGSNTSTGEPDKKWNFRPERLLTAACLRLDPGKIKQFPLDAKTEEGGTYNPSAPDAPLTIYATGVRSGFDLLWHSNGHLYTGLNGAAAGGNTPGTSRSAAGQAVPPIFDLRQTTHDLLLKITPGGYYGHPNPVRGEYVLMGGNPTKEVDPQEIRSYPVGILPEPNFKLPAFDFGFNISPNGLCEYRGNAFGGRLNGKILVTRYSGGKDIIVLSPGADGNIVEAITGIDGFTQFSDPLDIAQHPTSGHLYVAEYGGRQITLLRPREGAVSRNVFVQVNR